MPRRRRRVTPKRLIAIAGGTVVLLGFGTGVVFASTSSSTEYRTAIVTTGNVDETLTVNGTIASATRRDLSFPVSGAVDDIAVAVGDTVTTGDTLAHLDTSDLQSALDDSQTKLDEAEQALDDDLTGQTSTSTSNAAPAAATTGASAISLVAFVAAAAVDPGVQSALDAVVAAQTALLAAIASEDSAVAAAQTAAVAAVNSCGAVAIPTADDPEGDGLDATQTATLQAALASAQSALASCQSDSSASSSAASAVASAQAAVDAASATLDADLTALKSAIAAAPSGSGSSGGGGAPSGGGSSAPSGSSGSSGGSTASAADLVADRAAISSAEADVAIAKQQLASAKLTAPIDGTVAQMTFAKGDAISAGDTSAVISVIGTDGYLIESTVSLAQVKKVATGQDAVVTISSSGASYSGSVTQVGITNVSETSDPAYDITISVDAAGDTLLNGAAASAQVSIASASDVLTVPLSGLHSSDSGYTVSRLVGGSPVATPVTVGAVGASSVEITSGLSPGDVVVVADLSSEIPTSDSSSSSGLTGLTSGGNQFTGGPPSGFTGGQRNG